MGVLYDYFAANDDAAAAALIDRQVGPAAPAAAATESGRRGLFRRRPDETEAPAALPLATVTDTGIDPVVQGGTLEELLTGRPYENIEQDPRWGRSLATRDGGERTISP